MKIFLYIVGIVVLAVILYIVYRYIKFQRQGREMSRKRFERIQNLFEKLEAGQDITEEEVLPYAKDLLARELTFRLLKDHNKADLFPEEYNTLLKGAESNLANWLEFPTELGTCPDEIEHMKRVSFDFDGQNNLVHYEVFKYKKNEPHWSAKNGWCVGVVGPYFDDSEPYDLPKATFSRTGSTMDKVSPEDEAKWVHEKISLRK